MVYHVTRGHIALLFCLQFLLLLALAKSYIPFPYHRVIKITITMVITGATLLQMYFLENLKLNYLQLLLTVKSMFTILSGRKNRVIFDMKL